MKKTPLSLSDQRTADLYNYVLPPICLNCLAKYEEELKFVRAKYQKKLERKVRDRTDFLRKKVIQLEKTIEQLRK